LPSRGKARPTDQQLLLWPSPTVSVLIWVAALVAYIGLIEPVLSVAVPPPVSTAGEPAEPAEPTVVGGNGAAAPSALCAPCSIAAAVARGCGCATIDSCGGTGCSRRRVHRPTPPEADGGGHSGYWEQN